MLAVTTVVGVVAAIAARPASAARASLSKGVLTITGKNVDDKIALRLKAGRPGILQVDVGDDGSADFSFKRKRVGKIIINARGGADTTPPAESTFPPLEVSTRSGSLSPFRSNVDHGRGLSAASFALKATTIAWVRSRMRSLSAFVNFFSSTPPHAASVTVTANAATAPIRRVITFLAVQKSSTEQTSTCCGWGAEEA
jgi:hypothetical protein